MVDFKILLMMALIGLCSAANRRTCKDKGGECMDFGSNCDGEVLDGKKYCRSKKEFCCVPNGPNGCPVWLDGYFYYAPSSQCFYYHNEKDSYTNGEAKCNAQGMTLAHPYDSIGLRRYMVERWGWAEPYLGARRNTDDDLFYWTDNDEAVPSSYWFPGQPAGDDGCMILLARDTRMESNPEQPFYSRLCSERYYTLCEWTP